MLQCLSLRNRAFEGALRVNGQAPSGDYFTTTGEGVTHPTQSSDTARLIDTCLIGFVHATCK
jgi:hypothetical protein